jgi:hypothetical protein
MTASLRFVRFVAAGVLTPLLAVAALLLAAVGQGHYLEDYCFTSAPVPDGAGSVRGPIWEFPATLHCQWNGAADVVTVNWLPFLWVAGCLMAGVAGIVIVWWILVVRPRTAASGRRQ